MQALGTSEGSTGNAEVPATEKPAWLQQLVGLASLALLILSVGALVVSAEDSDAAPDAADQPVATASQDPSPEPTPTPLATEANEDADNLAPEGYWPTETTDDTALDSDVEWAYISGLWNATPAATKSAVCRDFRLLGPASFYSQTYLAYNPQPVHADGRILSEETYTDFHRQACSNQ